MNRTEIINFIVGRYGYSSYLEIGLGDCQNYNDIKCNHKIGVDPFVDCQFKMRSREFSKTWNEEWKFDLIFIDGDHNEYQATADIVMSLRFLKPSGTIVLHDCNPLTEHATREINEGEEVYGIWNGTVYKSFAIFRNNPWLFMCVIDDDNGVGIIRRGAQPHMQYSDLSYKYFDSHREDILNLVTFDEFAKLIA